MPKPRAAFPVMVLRTALGIMLVGMLFHLLGCGDGERKQALDQYKEFVIQNGQLVNLFYRTPTPEAYASAQHIWELTPDEAMQDEDDVVHTAALFYVFSHLVEAQYGMKLRSDVSWKSDRLRTHIESLTKQGVDVHDLIYPQIITVDTLDYNWSAYSATGKLEYPQNVRAQCDNPNPTISGAAKWSYRSMSEQDDRLPK